MEYIIKEENQFRYVEKGEGDPILLLHGLFGALSNFSDLIQHFSNRYRVIIPLMPIYENELEDATVSSLVDYIDEFTDHKQLRNIILVGNSLGGHVGILFTLRKQEKIKILVLTGSSGLFENTIGNSFPRRGDYDFIKAKTQATFYDPSMASKELVDEVFEIVNNRHKVLCVLSMAKSAIRHNLKQELPNIYVPTLLIWGAQDTVTPLFVGEEFNKLIPHSILKVVQLCGHAPMMEKPAEFNQIMENYLAQNDRK